MRFPNRTAAVSWSVPHGAIGESREGAGCDETKSEDLPVIMYPFFGLKKDMFPAHDMNHIHVCHLRCKKAGRVDWLPTGPAFIEP